MPSQLNDPDWDQVFDAAGKKYDVDPRLLKAQMYVESGPNSTPVARINSTEPGTGVEGPMQLMPTSFPDVDRRDPYDAIHAAARYMAEGRAKVGDDPAKMLMYYYSGSADPKNWGQRTQSYPGMVAKYYGQIGTPLATGGSMPQSINDIFGGKLPDDWDQVGTKSSAGGSTLQIAPSPVPTIGATSMPTGAVPLAPPVGQVGSLESAAKSNDQMFDQYKAYFDENRRLGLALDRAGELFTRFQAGKGVELGSALSAYARRMMPGPVYKNLVQNGFLADTPAIEEATKEGIQALFAQMDKVENPAVSKQVQMEKANPNPVMQPETASDIIAQLKATMNYQNDKYQHMLNYRNTNGSMYGYNPGEFESGVNMRGYYDSAKQGMPQFKGEIPGLTAPAGAQVDIPNASTGDLIKMLATQPNLTMDQHNAIVKRLDQIKTSK